METVPLHEAVRPAGHRDDAGILGENMHQLADDIEQNGPELVIHIGDSKSTDPEYWQSVVQELQGIRSISSELFSPAIARITKLAKTG